MKTNSIYIAIILTFFVHCFSIYAKERVDDTTNNIREIESATLQLTQILNNKDTWNIASNTLYEIETLVGNIFEKIFSNHEPSVHYNTLLINEINIHKNVLLAVIQYICTSREQDPIMFKISSMPYDQILQECRESMLNLKTTFMNKTFDPIIFAQQINTLYRNMFYVFTHYTIKANMTKSGKEMMDTFINDFFTTFWF